MKDYLNHESIFHILSYISSSTIDMHLTFSKNLYFYKIVKENAKQIKQIKFMFF